MKVKELINILNSYDPELLVVTLDESDGDYTSIEEQGIFKVELLISSAGFNHYLITDEKSREYFKSKNYEMANAVRVG